MVESQVISITAANHADAHRHGGDDPLTGDVRIDTLGSLDTITDVTGSRVLGTNYQNTNSDKMLVIVVTTCPGAAGRFYGYVKSASPPDDVISIIHTVADVQQTMVFVVPSGYYYKVSLNAGAGSILHWNEYV